jgi:hypothetical protein
LPRKKLRNTIIDESFATKKDRLEKKIRDTIIEESSATKMKIA